MTNPKSHRAPWPTLLAGTLISILLATSAAAQAANFHFDISGKPLSQALRDYGQISGLDIIFTEDLVEGLSVAPLRGEFTAEDALRHLLKGTGLIAEQSPSGALMIRRASSRNAAAVTPAGSSMSAARYESVQDQPQAAENEASATTGSDDEREERRTIEEIVITGSRIRGAQSASPVATITREEIDQAGFATVEQIVDNLPQNFGAGATLDTSVDLNSVSTAVGGNVDNFAGGTSVNLRGLGAGATLILVNGRRLSPSGGSARFTDVSGIPVSAIERVEVMTDGASAIYGSDSIGGVVNFILRQDYDGAETRLRYGTDTGGDTSDVLFGQALGRSWQDGNILLTYEYYEKDNLANSDRDFAASQDLTRFGGTDWRTAAGGNPANIVAGGQTFAIPTGQDGTSLTAADFDPNAPLNVHDERANSDLLPQVERHSVLLNLVQDFGAIEVFADARYSTRDTVTRRNLNGSGVSFDVPDTNPFFVDPTGSGLTTVRIDNYFFTDDLGPRIYTGESDSYAGTFALRFDIGTEWNGELAGNWAKEEADLHAVNVVDQVALAEALGQADPTLAFNPFGDGSNTNPAVLESILQTGKSGGNQAENELWAVNLSIDGTVFDMTGGAIRAAAGVEFREEALLSEFRSRQPDGTNVIRPGLDASRDVLAVYTELFFPLVGNSNRHRGLQRLEISLAGRYEHYGDFGSTTNPKVGVLWSPIQAVALRATYGTSYKAPRMFDLDISNPEANLFAYVPQLFVDLGLLDSPALVLLGGNENLNAEEATTWTAGIEWNSDRFKGLSLDMTYFSIDYDGRIDVPFANFFTGFSDPRFESLLTLNPTPDQIAAIVNDPRYDPNVFGSPAPAADLISGVLPVGSILSAQKNNLAKSMVTGLELQLAYDIQTAAGSFDIGLNANYLFDFERAFTAADPLVDEVDTLGRPIDFRARGSVTWSSQSWSVSGYINYTDGYTDNISTPARPIEALTTVDLSASYRFGADSNFPLFSRTRWSLTVQNVFNEDPPFADTFGGLAYDSANHNPLGRFLALQLTREW